MAARNFFNSDQLAKVVPLGTCFLGPVQYDRTFLGPVQYDKIIWKNIQCFQQCKVSGTISWVYNKYVYLRITDICFTTLSASVRFYLILILNRFNIADLDIHLSFFFYSVLRPFQDYFSSFETGQSVGGAKMGEPREKPPDTPASRTWLVSHVARAGLEPAPDTVVR